MFHGRNGYAPFAPYDMTLKEIKSELSLENKLISGSKESLWNRLIAVRFINAKSENDINPFGGPALDVLVNKIFTNKWPMMSSMNCNDELQMAIKILMTKEIAGHIANYVEIPEYFGPCDFRMSHKKCLWKCKQICLCNELAPPCSGWQHLERWTSIDSEYQELKNAWSAARKEWESMRESKENKHAKYLVECASSVSAILPCDICELITDKIILSNYEDPYKTLESKKELSKKANLTYKLLDDSKEIMNKSKKRLDRCGYASRRAALKAGKEFVESPSIQKNKALLTREYEKNLNAFLTLQKEKDILMNRCKDEGVAFSTRNYTFVPA